MDLLFGGEAMVRVLMPKNGTNKGRDVYIVYCTPENAVSKS